jgi:hypothetical protein
MITDDTKYLYWILSVINLGLLWAIYEIGFWLFTMVTVIAAVHYWNIPPIWIGVPAFATIRMLLNGDKIIRRINSPSLHVHIPPITFEANGERRLWTE